MTIPWIIYFALNSGLSDMINVYFIINIFSYNSKTSLIMKIFTAFKEGIVWAIKLPQYSIISLIGYVYIMISKKIIPNIQGKITLTLSILVSMLGIYIGTNHVYYFLILMGFIVLGIIFIARMIEKLKNKKLMGLIKYGFPVYLVIIIVLTCVSSNNFRYNTEEKDELVQYKFAKIINEKPNATLLNYGFLDGGFYIASNIVPNVKYFHKPNIEHDRFPEIEDEQNRYVAEKITDFVVIKVEKEEDSYNIPNLYENYEKLDSVYDGNINEYYMLFKVKA